MPPRREVHHAEALTWLRARGRLEGCSVVTSLPDVAEMAGMSLPDWSGWFVDAARIVLDAVPDSGVAMFFQSDVKRGSLWVDKAALVQRAAEAAGAPQLFHKIVCRKPAGTVTFGRASYSHLLAYSRGVRPPPERATADVLPDGGFQSSPKAMGLTACLVACRFIARETTTATIVDPFCGYGTVLAVANAIGLDAVGVDLSTRMVRRARALTLHATMFDGLALDDLVTRFLAGTLPRAEWTHAAHLAVGLWHVHQYGPEEAILRLRSGIRSLNERHGTANTETSGYHETITVAYVRLIGQFLSACPPGGPLEERVRELLGGPLADRAFLLRFWSRELLMSPAARAAWTAPDLAPLSLGR
jgi:hypothetical protein